MPRQARIDAPGALHHIICRGIERKPIFLSDDDREDFVTRLQLILPASGTRCYAWALIPNHFHLLLRTGATPISTVMRRLLTGYAVAFNRRYRRSGHLFQNRYKSILCQDDLYLLELVRYIHLNPLRAGLVASLDTLASHPWCGHRQIAQAGMEGIVDVDEILAHFDSRAATARSKYLLFVADGAEMGSRPEFSGGGVIRSLLTNPGMGADLPPGDERILGDGDFVTQMLAVAEEQADVRERLRRKGYGLERLAQRVAEVLKLEVGEVLTQGKQPLRVRARSLYCYWAVRELGHTATAVAALLGISQPAVSQAVQRGERLVAEEGWSLLDEGKL